MTSPPQSAAITWRKSSFSTGQNDCVEIAATSTIVLIRDSKNPDGDRLSVTGGVWGSFITAIKSGQVT